MKVSCVRSLAAVESLVVYARLRRPVRLMANPWPRYFVGSALSLSGHGACSMGRASGYLGSTMAKAKE